MLEYINLVLILFIIGVVIFQMVLLLKTRSRLDSESKNLQDKLQKISVPNTLVDLGEFKTLDNDFKDAYKDVVVDGVLPIINEKMNDALRQDNAAQVMRENKANMIQYVQQQL